MLKLSINVIDLISNKCYFYSLMNSFISNIDITNSMTFLNSLAFLLIKLDGLIILNLSFIMI